MAIPIGLVLFGISVAATIVAATADALTEEEEKEQNNLKEEIERKQRDFANKKRLLDLKYSEKFSELSRQEREKIDKELADFEGHEKELKKKFRYTIIEKANDRIQKKKDLIQEIGTTNKNIRGALKKQGSLLRRVTLQKLTRELDETKAKVYAYIEYLKDYIRYMSLDLDESQICCFNFLLPSNAIYIGKLVYFEKENVEKEICIEPGIVQRFIIEDYQEGKFLGGNKIPLLCVDYDFKNRVFKLSNVKGMLKSFIINNPKVGITAVVDKYEQLKNGWKYINLKFENEVNLILPYRNLENSNRIPPIGANLRVYPVNWDYTLYRNIEVSEHSNDAYLNMSFDHVPVVFTQNQWYGEFEEYLKLNELVEHAGDWKIAPINEADIPNINKVKMQLDNDLVFAADIINLSINDRNIRCFSFSHMLDKKEMIKPDDIFLGIDCTLDTVLDDEIEVLENGDFDNMESLILATLSEFKVQKQIKVSQKGMPYFEKWCEVTDKLVNYLYKGPSIEILLKEHIECVKQTKSEAIFKVKIDNPELLNKFVDEMYDRYVSARNVKFFFEIEEYNYQYVTINADSTYLTIKGDTTQLNVFFENNEKTLLYCKDQCYAEIQQLSALNSFRMGRMYNPILQGYALDASNIVSDIDCQYEDVVLFNKDIEKDSSQKNAVLNALKEKNLFLIQGPPGTGKTTVIREIIEQTLAKKPKSKILVVSQANVAVDNVLKGLLEKGYDFVRCGSNSKIDSELEEYSFDYIYNIYLDNLKDKYAKNQSDVLLKNWLDEINIDDYSQYNSMLGELIIKSKPIIGATCVGLAKKRIGLDRVLFDLVIVDEAGKALPAEILIPYIRGSKVIMIGDHKQLPPTLNSALMDNKKVGIEDREIFEDELFSDSLFAKMFNSAPESNKCMLTTQYRMPTVIGSLISDCFYGQHLVNGENTASRIPLGSCPQNIIFVDTDAPEHSEKGESVYNEKEAKTALKIVKTIYKSEQNCPRIAIITPYKGQLRMLRGLFDDSLDPYMRENIDINTIDAFQGDEAEIVIFCTTRQKVRTKFFTDYRRINVALSRSKNLLFIIGALKYFDSYKGWGSGESPLPKIAEYVRKYANIIREK